MSDSAKKTRTRVPTLQGEMKDHIVANPEATKNDVVQLFLKRYPDKARSTLAQYYHKQRKLAGLSPNGTPGRRKGDTYPAVLEVVRALTAANPDVTVPDLKEAVLNRSDIDLCPASAQVYVYKARNEIKSN